MLKEMEKTSGDISPDRELSENVLVQICRDDFRLQDDGSWITTREITINGHGGTQRLIKAGREFKKGELSMFGLDLAAVLERHLIK